MTEALTGVGNGYSDRWAVEGWSRLRHYLNRFRFFWDSPLYQHLFRGDEGEAQKISRGISQRSILLWLLWYW